RLVETLNQPQYDPWPVEDQVAIIFAATKGYLDDIEVAKVPEFNQGLRDFLKSGHAAIGDTIRTSKELSDDTTAKLNEAIRAFKADFVGGQAPVPGTPVEA
ncbi:MAG TPA: hypothetical protein VFD74_00105, partial [Thermoleophilia bacterium]|nr:hypothetical protein [Thermoleophilia bacterium]